MVLNFGVSGHERQICGEWFRPGREVEEAEQREHAGNQYSPAEQRHGNLHETQSLKRAKLSDVSHSRTVREVT